MTPSGTRKYSSSSVRLFVCSSVRMFACSHFVFAILLLGLMPTTVQSQDNEAKFESRSAPFDTLLANHTVITFVRHNEPSGQPISLLEETIRQHKTEPRLLIEKTWHKFSISEIHPTWVEIFWASDRRAIHLWQGFQFENNGAAIKQPQRIELYLEKSAADYQSATPFFGPTVAADSFSELLDLIVNPNNLVTGGPGEISFRHTIPERGEFEVTYDEDEFAMPKRLKHTLSQGDQITKARKLGVQDGKPTTDPRTITKYVAQWDRFATERNDKEIKVLGVSKRTTTVRLDGSEESDEREIKFDYLPINDPPEKFVFVNKYFELSPGAPLTVFPADHRRYELMDGLPVLVIDQTASNAIDSIDPETRDLAVPGGFWTDFGKYLIAGCIVVVFLIVVYLLRKS